MKILTIVGARPQFIKAAAVSKKLREEFEEVLVHTGQHYDDNMSEVFFSQMGIPRPEHNLHIGSGNHGYQTGQMLIEIEKLCEIEKPDIVLVYGDTNSTLAGALAASKLHIPVAHIEAGLRSFNKRMPEEQNRIVADHLSALLFAPTQAAVDNLEKENITSGVYMVGDVMYDATLHFLNNLNEKEYNDKFRIDKPYMLATIHRAENTDDPKRLSSIINALNESGRTIVFPLHPRTKKYISEYGLSISNNIRILEPVGYLEMLYLEKNAEKILTDSGGVQKEAYFLEKPCITTREETEWVETVQNGWNTLVGSNKSKILNAIENFMPVGIPPKIFGDGDSAREIISIIKCQCNVGT